MKTHKHAEVIKAWADGSTVQFKHKADGTWEDITSITPIFFLVNKTTILTQYYEYRIKPEKDYVRYIGITSGKDVAITTQIKSTFSSQDANHWIELTFDGHTNELVSAKAVK